MTKKRWKSGAQLGPVEALETLMRNEPLMVRGKWTHPGWARSWQVNMLIYSARNGVIRRAIKIEEDDDE